LQYLIFYVKMKIVIIGAGNLATNIGVALSRAGHDILQVYSRTMQSATNLAEKLKCDCTTDVDAISDEAELYVFSVKDSALAELVSKVCARHAGKCFAHTAGSIPMSVFCGHAKRFGVLYPLQTFSKNKLLDFKEIPLFVEGSDVQTKSILRQVAESLSSKVFLLDSDRRKYLHLSAVFACNFVNHCYALASDILSEQGLDYDVLLPLINETAAKVGQMKPANAQTGPAVRYDENVIGMQAELLKDNQMVHDIYLLMSKSIAKKSGKL